MLASESRSTDALDFLSRPYALMVVAAVLFAAEFALLATTDPTQLGALPFALPVALIAVQRGLRDGVAASLVAVGLYVLAADIDGTVDITAVSIVSRALPLAVVAGAIGWLAEHLRREAADARAMQRDLVEREASLRALFEHALDAIAIADDDRRFVEVNPAAVEVLGVSRDRLLGRRMDEFLAGESAAEVQGRWQEFLNRGAQRGEYSFQLEDGSRRALEFSATASFLPGRHLFVLRDVTERKQVQRQLQERIGQQAAIADLSLQALAGDDPELLMQETAERVAETLHVEYANVLELRPEENRLLLKASVGWSEELVGSASMDAGLHSQAGLALAGGESVIVDDLTSDGRFRESSLLRGHDVVSGVSVVIRSREGHWGVLSAHTRSHRKFSADDVYFLRSIANTIALAMERSSHARQLRDGSREIAKLAADRQQIVAEALNAEDRTRQRISQLLHDEVLQSLLTARQDLAQAEADGASQEESLRYARAGIQQAIAELRSAVFDLHPAALGHGGLGSAIKTLAEHQARRAGFQVIMDLSPRADGLRDQLILSLVRELLTNAARHSEAQEVRISLDRIGNAIAFEVADDGRGMEASRPDAALKEGHIGLASASQRVEALGGRFQVHTRVGAGTRIRASIPIDAMAKAP